MNNEVLIADMAGLLSDSRSNRLTTKDIALALVGPLHATRYRARISKIGREDISLLSRIVERKCGATVTYVGGDWYIKRDTRVPSDPFRDAVSRLTSAIVAHRKNVPAELLKLSVDVERALGAK